jgi:hypothetical protein
VHRASCVVRELPMWTVGLAIHEEPLAITSFSPLKPVVSWLDLLPFSIQRCVAITVIMKLDIT